MLNMYISVCNMYFTPQEHTQNIYANTLSRSFARSLSLFKHSLHASKVQQF